MARAYLSERLTVEFLLTTVAKNLQYIILVLEALALFGIVNFTLNPQHFPTLTLIGEWNKVVSFTYNPIFIYGHYLYVFYSMAKGFALTFFNTLKFNVFPAAIMTVLIVNLWLTYSRLRYGEYSKNTGVTFIRKMMKSVFANSNFIENSLWMIFFVDFIVVITTPTKFHIIFLLLVYALLFTVKFFPEFTRLFVDTSNSLERTVLYNKWIILGVVLLDVVLIYFDSRSLFTLFIMMIVYNLIAMVVLRVLKEYKKLHDWAFYIFNIGLLLFFFSLIVIYFISFIAVTVIQLPILLYYYLKDRKFIPAKVMEYVNIVILVVMLIIFF